MATTPIVLIAATQLGNTVATLYTATRVKARIDKLTCTHRRPGTETLHHGGKEWRSLNFGAQSGYSEDAAASSDKISVISTCSSP